MTREEVIELMDKPRSAARIPQYKVVYKMTTGKDWNKCFCGNGFDNFYRVCKNYSEALKKQINNETIIIS